MDSIKHKFGSELKYLKWEEKEINIDYMVKMLKGTNIETLIISYPNKENEKEFT